MTLTSWLAVLIGFALLLGGIAALVSGSRRLAVPSLLGGLGLVVLGGWIVEGNRGLELIAVVSGHYGRNCAAPEGNATPGFARACEQRQQVCFYRVDHAAIGDPCWGQHKDFVARWRCGNRSRVHELWVPAEASAKEVELHCPEGTGEVRPPSGPRLPLLEAVAAETRKTADTPPVPAGTPPSAPQ
jgi:hypothetical protein